MFTNEAKASLFAGKADSGVMVAFPSPTVL